MIDNQRHNILGNAEQVNEKILEIYPFLKETEKREFKGKGVKVLKSNGGEVGKIKKLLILLKNGHANINLLRESINKDTMADWLKTIRPSYRIIKDNLYIQIPSWNKNIKGLDDELIKICIENKDKYKAIIIDVRKNSGGSTTPAYNFASIFFNKDVNFGTVVKRNGKGVKKLENILPPNGKIYIDKPIAILISNVCFSSCELFLSIFKATKRATLIGEKTRGGSGAPILFDLNVNGKKHAVKIPTHRIILKGETRPLEETSIAPDIYYSKKDIINFAINYLSRLI